MKADEADVQVLTRLIARLEAELKTNPPARRRATIRRQLQDARELRAFIVQEAGIELPH